MKGIVILFYCILTIYQFIFGQEALYGNERIFENNSLDSLIFSIPESLVLNLVSDTLKSRESTTQYDFKDTATGEDIDTLRSFNMEVHQDSLEGQRNDVSDTVSYESDESTVHESNHPEETSGPDIIAVEDEDTTYFEETDHDISHINELYIFIDHSQGMNVPRFNITPKNLTYNGKPSFLFDFGIFFPFLKLFYGGISIRYLKLSLMLTESDSFFSQPQRIDSKIDTKEYLKFISVPFEVGMRLKFGRFIPYIFLDLEPAFLTAANQSALRNTHFYFDTAGPQKRVEERFGLNVRDNRTALQMFFGGGLGLELVYNYGSLFADIGCHFALLKTVSGKDYKSMPYRASNSLFYFPLSLGLRFYL